MEAVLGGWRGEEQRGAGLCVCTVYQCMVYVGSSGTVERSSNLLVALLVATDFMGGGGGDERNREKP